MTPILTKDYHNVDLVKCEQPCIIGCTSIWTVSLVSGQMSMYFYRQSIKTHCLCYLKDTQCVTSDEILLELENM